MGKSLVRILAQAGHNVTVTSRSSHSLILSNINYVNWLMGLILCCFFLMFAIVNQARFYSCFKY